MDTTQFKIAFRRLLKYRQFSVINLLGLSIGLACFLMILLWVKDECSFDAFHDNVDNIYMVTRGDSTQEGAVTSLMLGPALVEEVPEIVASAAVCILPSSFKPYIRNGDVGFEESLALTDERFFDVFSFELMAGEGASVFQAPNSIVITERMSRKYFGDESAMGKTLELTFLGKTLSVEVTGVLKDLPTNTHIYKDFFLPIDLIVQSFGFPWKEWHNQPVTNYIVTQGGVDPDALSEKILDCKTSHFKERNVHYSLIPLKKLHLHSSHLAFFNTTGDIKYVYFFGLIASIILLIACMNYANLSNALALKRAKEIGIQKVVGAERMDLIRQHFGETLLLTVLATLIAMLFVELSLPLLSKMSGKTLNLEWGDSSFWLMLLIITAATSVLSSLLPAWFISGFQPLQVLKGTLKSSPSSLSLRNVFIVIQFTLSIIIVICTLIVRDQLTFMQHTDLGYDRENIICLKLNENIGSRYDSFRQALLTNPSILQICRSEPLNVESLGKTGDLRWRGAGEDIISTWVIHVDEDFAATYGITMTEGRFYNHDFSTDATQAFVVNETAKRMMGFDTMVGETLSMWGRTGTVIGVSNDFHFASLHHAIEPLVFFIPELNDRGHRYRELSVRVAPNSIQPSIDFLNETWKSHFPDQPFNFYLFDEHLNASYQAEKRMGVLFSNFSILAILIACLGLYGLISFTIEQKVKEIGIYKILGAGVTHIMMRITRRYVNLIFVANLIAWPAAYFLMNRWLETFASRVEISFALFLLTGLSVLTLALLTITRLVFRAALANPVESLRYE